MSDSGGWCTILMCTGIDASVLKACLFVVSTLHTSLPMEFASRGGHRLLDTRSSRSQAFPREVARCPSFSRYHFRMPGVFKEWLRRSRQRVCLQNISPGIQPVQIGVLPLPVCS